MRRTFFIVFGFYVIFSYESEENIGNYESEYNGYDDDHGESNPCTIYENSDYEGDECHHAKFPNETQTIKKLFGNKVRECCPTFHGFIYQRQCEDEKHTYMKDVCDSPNDEPEVLSFNCPKHCTSSIDLTRSDFNITEDGQLKILNNDQKYQTINVENYCIAYHCAENSRKWEIKARTCLCLDGKKFEKSEYKFKKEIQKLTKPRHSPYKMCCGNSSFAYDDCKKDMEIVQWNPEKCTAKTIFNIIDDSCQIGFDSHMKPEIFPEERLDNSCIGLVWSGNSQTSLAEMKIFDCSPTCSGSSVCIRTCCGIDRIGANCDHQSSGIDYKSYTILDNVFNSSKNNEELKNILTKARPHERKCPSHFKKEHLKPGGKCEDDFILDLENDKIVLYESKRQQNKPYAEHEFCLYFNDNSNLGADICRFDRDSYKFKIYPYVLMVSCVFLLITFIVYSKYPKLLNHYTRLMRHNVLVTLIAYILLTVTHLTSFMGKSLDGCVIYAYALQYAFITSFTILTVMSYELWTSINGKTSTNSRYRLQMIISYGFPIFITLITGIGELTINECSVYKPRFCTKGHFFADVHSKGLFLYLPIGILLIINACMFALVVLKTLSLDKEMRKLNLRNHKQRTNEMERLILFVKMFFCMGFTWTFEIIGGLHSDDSTVSEYVWYVTDFLNMLQGVFLFGFFVCKRNVKEAIFGKSLKRPQNQNAKSRITSATTTLRTRISSRFSRNSKQSVPRANSQFYRVNFDNSTQNTALELNSIVSNNECNTAVDMNSVVS